MQFCGISTLTVLYSHTSYLILRWLHHLQRSPLTHEYPPLHSSFPPAPGNYQSVFFLYGFLFLWDKISKPHTQSTYPSHFTYKDSYNMHSLCLTYFTENIFEGRPPYSKCQYFPLFMTEYKSTLWPCRILLTIHQLIDIGFSPCGYVYKNLNFCVQMFESLFSVLSGKELVVRLLGHVVIPCLTSWRTTGLFPQQLCHSLFPSTVYRVLLSS